MTFEPRRGQEHVLEATDPVLVVLGGAGTGKTTVAAAAVRRILDRSIDHGTLRRRALFLSFSRAAVGQVVHRTSKTLGSQTDFVEITTFHAFAWKLIRRWGDAIGVAEPRLISPSEAKLFGSTVGTTFDELLPLALKLLEIPAIRKHFERRWAVIVSDEFQDTSRDQFELIMRIRGHARLLLLGDLNQCIYSNLPGAVGVGPTRIAAALALPGARAVHLPDVSHRDPTNILPAAAAAIRQRNFNHASVRAALDSGMLEVRHHHDPSAEGALIADLVTELQAAGHETVGIFSHHVDSTASLSDSLNGAGIAHEIVGLPDSVTSALQTQFEMLSYSAGEGSASMVRRALAVFVTSTERGGRAPELARMIAGYITAPTTLQARLARLNSNLVLATNTSEVLGLIARVPKGIGLTRGERAWERSTIILRALLGPRIRRAAVFPTDGFDFLRAQLADQQVSLLTSNDNDTSVAVQLMGLYQSKGREADATIVVLRSNDYFGNEVEPMPNGSKLLYVVLTRARTKTVVLTLGSRLPSLIDPLAELATRSGR